MSDEPLVPATPEQVKRTKYVLDDKDLIETIDKRYDRAFTPQGFRHKLRRYARRIGHGVVNKILILYYTLRAPETPTWAKTTILGALGYFISFVDALPDMTPFIGYTDDIGIIMAALGAIQRYITPEIIAKADEQTEKFMKPD